MTDIFISQNKWDALRARLASLGVKERDLDETFARSGGAGGQNVNKVSSCVILVHRPSGLSVRCQEERSQALNRFLARRRLADLMEEKILGEKSRRRREIEKIRRQKRKRSRRAKEKILRDKRHVSRLKNDRRSLDDGGG